MFVPEALKSLYRIIDEMPLTSILIGHEGRVLDAVSFFIGAGTVRTYEGEPAIRLERYLEEGRPSAGLKAEVKEVDGRKVVETLPALRWLFEGGGEGGILSDRAVSVVRPVADDAPYTTPAVE